MSKRKLSMETRVKISNSKHYGLSRKALVASVTAKTRSAQNRASLKHAYHQQVGLQQEKYGCLLTRSEKEIIYNSIRKYNDF